MNYPTPVEIKHDNKIGRIVLERIRTIDKQRILKDLGNSQDLKLKRLSYPERSLRRI